MSFLILVALIAVIWLLWNIGRNTGDALDKHTAIQYEIVSLEKRIEELLDKLSEMPAAGGTTPVEQESQVEANQEAPKKGSTTKKPNTPSSSKQAAKTVNINTATLTQIVKLPRIGKALGQRIVDGRPYDNINDLLRVQGISKELLEEISSKLSC